jgi:uncharacterized protein DUF4124
MIRSLAFVLALAPFPLAAQQMYKWVDEKGTTHFSEYPPPEGKDKATKVEVKPPAIDNKYNPDAWREKERAAREERAKQGVAADDAKKREQATNASRCQRAREGLDTVKNSRRVYNVDEKGERVYMDDKDRPAAIEKWQREVEQYCR